MDDAARADARSWAERYIAIVEAYDLCPWAAPARARGEVWIEACEVDEVEDALARFTASPDAVVGLCVIPNFDGDPTALRRWRGALCERPLGRILALADFHPDATLDATTPQRLIPFLRRSPDPLIQAVRHETLANLRRGGTMLVPSDQLAALAGRPPERPRDVSDQVAETNHARMQQDGVALAAALDELVTARRADRASRGRPRR